MHGFSFHIKSIERKLDMILKLQGITLNEINDLEDSIDDNDEDDAEIAEMTKRLKISTKALKDAMDLNTVNKV